MTTTDKNSSTSWMKQRIRIGHIVTFAFNIILWVCSIGILVLAFMNAEKFKKSILGLSVLATLFLLIISIAFLYYMWGIAALSGACNIGKEILKGNQKVLEDIDASEFLKKKVNMCFFTTDGNTYS